MLLEPAHTRVRKPPTFEAPDRINAALKDTIAPVPSYVVVASQGRCGSNWFLEIFDQSPSTHCRTDANAFDGSPFARLPSPVVWNERNDQALEAGWDAALQWAHERMGVRDAPTTVPKTYLHETSRALGLVSLVQRAKSRRLLASLVPSLRHDEWILPRWLGDGEKLSASMLVVKLGLPAGWMPWVMRHRPDVHVIHLVRHPGGYLTSWMARFLARQDCERTTQDNRLRLYQVQRADAGWSRRLGDIASMSAEEAELWYWLYCTETTHTASATSKRHDRVLYEDLLGDVVGVTRPIFERTGLEWNATIERRIRATAQLLPTQASRWREKIDPQHLALVERVLGSSPVAGWW